jgi:hypothetical protein
MKILRELKTALQLGKLAEFMAAYQVNDEWVRTVTQANGWKLV